MLGPSEKLLKAKNYTPSFSRSPSIQQLGASLEKYFFSG
jgi:hypothetical protein